jgi:hypothetical protein
VFDLDHRFGQVAIDYAQLALEEGIAVTVSVDARGLKVTRAGKDGAEVVARKSEARGNGTVEHEKLVAAGGDAPPDAEEVARSGLPSLRVSVVSA